MAPVAIYLGVVLVIMALAVVLRFVIVVPRRECLNCGANIAASAPKCRRCGYRYASGADLAEERRYLD